MKMLLACVLAAFAGTPDAAYVQKRDALVHDGTNVAIAALAAGTWERKILAADVRAWQDDPVTAAQIWAAEPVLSRARGLRFADPAFAEGGASGPVLARLVYGGDSSEVRVALVAALPQSDRAWGPIAGAFVASEKDVLVRQAVVASARYANTADAVTILSHGFADVAPLVRAEAARTAPWLEHGDELGSNVLTALSDADAGVRAEAARAAGWMAVEGAWQPLVGLLSDSDARVRLYALRSLQKLDPKTVSGLPQLESLRQDDDVKVQRAAMEAAE